MSAIQFVVRDYSGILQNGAVNQSSNIEHIAMTAGSAVSLDARRLDVTGYLRQGDDLVLVMASGQQIVLENYFGADGDPQAKLYLNEGGHLIETDVSATGTVTHSEVASWGKWGELQALTFPSDPVVSADASEAGDEVSDAYDVASADQGGYLPTGEETTMGAGFGLAPLAAVGGNGLGTAAGVLGAAAVVGGTVAVTGGGKTDDGDTPDVETGTDTGGGSTIIPTIDDPDEDFTYNGDSEKTVTITGQAEPGSSVEVTIGDKTVTVIADANGTWDAEFSGDNFPADGEYEVTVIVTDLSGKVTELDGQTIVIDTTPPDLDVTGYGSTVEGDVMNAVEHDAGVTLEGTGEAGAAISVLVDGVAHTTTVSGNGTWSVDLSRDDLPGGEYTFDVVVTATDAFGNSTTMHYETNVDTIAPDLVIGAPQAGDGIVNVAEAQAGVDITGMAEPGATVDVSMNGATYSTVAGADGSWTVNFASTDFPAGEYTTTITAVATDAAGNVTSTTADLDIDTETSVAILGGHGGDDGVVNRVERDAGVTFDGTGEPGATINVAFANGAHTATVDADGSWSVTFAPGEIPDGEYSGTMVVVTTDSAGNTATATEQVMVDTNASFTAMISGVGPDGVFNASEAEAGLSVTGQGEPGAQMSVQIGTSTQTTTVAANGMWAVSFPDGSIEGGEYATDVVVTSTDAAGNVSQAATTLTVDSLVSDLALTGDPSADGVLSGAELESMLTFTGTVEPGSTVRMSIGHATRMASVDADGNWTVNFQPGDIPTGEFDTTLTVTAMDAAGNTAVLTDSVRVDTEVNRLSITSTMGGDGYVNASEAAMGLTLTGVVESGSSVMVALNGTLREATVDADGNWQAGFSAGEVGTGEGALTATVGATDAAGNTATTSQSAVLDTKAPEAPFVTGFYRSGDDLQGFTIDAGDATAQISTLARDGSEGQVSTVSRANLIKPDEMDFFFTEDLPDGSHLVITKTDEAGNESGTLFALDEGNSNAIDLGAPGMAGQDIEAVDLRFAEDSTLTIDASLLESLSGNSNSLTIHGSADDAVQIDTTDGSPFTDTNEDVTIGDETYSVYTLGDEGGTLIIDDDINIT